MAITITCADGENNFVSADGSTNNSHNFQGLLLDDGTNVQRLINPVQLARKSSSVLVFDQHGNYRDIAVSEVAAASTVDELIELLIDCRSSKTVLFDLEYDNHQSITITFGSNGGDLYSFYQNGLILLFQNGQRLISDSNYTVNNVTDGDDTITLINNTHFNGANYTLSVIK